MITEKGSSKGMYVMMTKIKDIGSAISELIAIESMREKKIIFNKNVKNIVCCCCNHKWKLKFAKIQFNSSLS